MTPIVLPRLCVELLRHTLCESRKMHKSRAVQRQEFKKGMFIRADSKLLTRELRISQNT